MDLERELIENHKLPYGKNWVHYADTFFTSGLDKNDPFYGWDFEQLADFLFHPRPMNRVRDRVRDWRLIFDETGATQYSDGWAKVRAGRKAQPNELGGKARSLFWNFASLAAGTAADIYVCGKIYKGDRNLTGLECHSALTSGGATAGGAYGTYAVGADGVTVGAVATSNLFLASTSFEAAGATILANSIALKFGTEALTDLFLACTNDTEAFATAGVLTGHLQLVRD